MMMMMKMATFSTRTRTSRVLNVRVECTIQGTELPALLHYLIIDSGKFLHSKSNRHIILEVSDSVPTQRKRGKVRQT